MSKLKNRINFTAMLAVGFILTVAGIYFYSEMTNFEDSSLSAHGVVVNMEKKERGRMAPVIQFVDANGNQQEFVSRTSSRPPGYQVDDAVVVLYRMPGPDRDLEAYIDEKWSILIRKFGVLAFGILFLLLGAVFGRIFWNRDSMHIGISYSKRVDIPKEQ